MARYICPSCGAPYNGKRCRACNYEHFSEEIAHGGHIHRGEPLVLEGKRRPIPRKDPFGCDKETRKKPFPRHEKKQRPFAGLFTIFLLIYLLLPMVRNWGLELEAREHAMQMEMVQPQNPVVIHEEGPITISVPADAMTTFPKGLPIWVENRHKDLDVYVTVKQVLANGFLMPYANVYVDAAADAYGMATLYLEDWQLEESFLTEVRELSFVLEVLTADHTTLFETDPITFRLEGKEIKQPQITGGVTLVDEDGIFMQSLGHWNMNGAAKYEHGQLKFYLENNTDHLLSMQTLETTVGGEEVSLYFWADIPAGAKAVMGLDLWALEELEFSTPTELGDLEMILEFRDLSTGSVKEYPVTMPMISRVPVVIE